MNKRPKHPCFATQFFLGILLTQGASLLPGGALAGSLHLSLPTMEGSISVTSWKALRDGGIVKQDLDYSCGAASAATIMNGFYGLNVTEGELLEQMEADGAASFRDLADVVKPYGLKGVGVALDFEQLRRLKVPAIAYLKYRGNDHFTVVRGIGADGSVLLADPSWGNRRLSRHQFLNMWETRPDERLKGKVLLLLPDGVDVAAIDRTFFGATEGNTVSKHLLLLRH